MGAQSTSIAESLADLYPTLHFFVQISCPEPTIRRDTSGRELKLSPRITVTTRILGARQPITDAAVYILHFSNAILAELRIHCSILCASSGIMLILTGSLLPEPGSMADPEIEATVRSRDLSLFQLTNKGEMEMAELLEMLDTVGDSVGRLVVTNKLYSRNNLVVALVVKYQLCGLET